MRERRMFASSSINPKVPFAPERICYVDATGQLREGEAQIVLGQLPWSFALKWERPRLFRRDPADRDRAIELAWDCEEHSGQVMTNLEAKRLRATTCYWLVEPVSQYKPRRKPRVVIWQIQVDSQRRVHPSILDPTQYGHLPLGLLQMLQADL